MSGLNEKSYDGKGVQYFNNPRKDIEGLLEVSAADALEVGCGTGATLEWLRVAGRCATTTGIELFPEAAKKAEEVLDKVYIGDVDRVIERDLVGQRFHLILCLDVLEHLPDPWATLRKLREKLHPSGRLIASIPNVRHFSVVAPLIFMGRWEYASSGILDKTHLRFFTRDTAMRLLVDSGFRVEGFLPNIAVGRSKVSWVNRLTFGVCEEFLTSQYLISASRSA